MGIYKCELPNIRKPPNFQLDVNSRFKPDIGLWICNGLNIKNLLNNIKPASQSFLKKIDKKYLDIMTFDGVSQSINLGDIKYCQEVTIYIICKSKTSPSGINGRGPIHNEENFQLSWDHSAASFRGAAGYKDSAGNWFAASYNGLSQNKWYGLGLSVREGRIYSYKSGIMQNVAGVGNPPFNVRRNTYAARHALSTNFWDGDIAAIYIDRSGKSDDFHLQLHKHFWELLVAEIDYYFTNEINSIAISSADSMSLSVNDISNVLFSIIAVADNQLLTLTDLLNIFTQLTTTDGLNLSIAESRQLLNALVTSENISASIIENLSLIDVALQAVETLNVTFSDAVQTIISISETSDSFSVAISDFANIFSAINLNDSFTLSLADAAFLVKSIQANNGLSFSINENAPVINLAITVSDTFDLLLVDSVIAIFSVLGRGDVVNVSIADIGNILSIVNRQDTLSLSVTENTMILTTLNALDALALSITDVGAKAAIGALIGKLSAKLNVYPALSGNLEIK